MFVDGRISPGIDRGFFQVLARLLDVAQLEIRPTQTVEEVPLNRINGDRLLDQFQSLLIANATLDQEITEVVKRGRIVRLAFEQVAQRLFRNLVLAGSIQNRAELDQRLGVIRNEFERFARRLFSRFHLTRLQLYAAQDEVNARVIGASVSGAFDHRKKQIAAVAEPFQFTED